VNDLFHELKRRKVVRVAVVYAATAFVILQAADIMLPSLGVPGWALSLIVVLLILGFPIALVLGWALELTPDGVRVTRPESTPSTGPPPSLLSRRAVLVSALLVALGIGLGTGFLLAPGGAPRGVAAGGGPDDLPAPQASLAVLPFSDMSELGDQEYLAQGLAEELLSGLAGIPGLRVAARTSSFALGNAGLPVDEVARRLGVSHVLEGSVRRSGDRLRITAQLVDAETGYRLWSEIFEREAGEVFRIQEEIARAVVDELRVRLGGEGALVATAARVTTPDTYDLYLRGRFLWRTGTRAALEEARLLLDETVARDPDFAPGWAGLADVYNRMANWGYRRPVEVLPSAFAAATRAVELDSLNGAARGTLGHTHRWWTRDRVAAGRELRRALELQPDNAEVREWYGWFLLDEGRTGEAVEQLRTAVALDPYSTSTAFLGHMLLIDGKFEEGLEQFALARLIPGPQGVTGFAEALFLNGRVDEAIRVLEAEAEGADRTTPLSSLGYMYGRAGRTEDARRVLVALRERASDTYVPALNEARVQIGLGDHDEALAALERAWDEGSLPPELNVVRWLEPLRGSPRYAELLRKLGLETGVGVVPAS
jgi:adenylate cyclase